MAYGAELPAGAVLDEPAPSGGGYGSELPAGAVLDTDMVSPQVTGIAPATTPQLSPRKALLIEEAKKRGIGDRLLSIFEPAASVVSSAVATPIAGIAGLASAPFTGIDKASDLIKTITEGMTYKPDTKPTLGLIKDVTSGKADSETGLDLLGNVISGPAGMEAVGRVLKPVADAYENFKTKRGDSTLEMTGSPALATAEFMAPDALLALLGLKGLQGVRPGTVLKDSAAQHILDGIMTSKKSLENELESYNNKFNATRVMYKNEWYDSAREADFAKRLDAEQIPYRRQVWFEIFPPFMLTLERVNGMKMKIDFLIYDTFIVDVKGDITPESKVKWKMFKWFYKNRYMYWFAFKKSEFDGIVTFIKHWKLKQPS